MSKKEYLKKLRRKLRSLPTHIVEDILRDYEDHFNDGYQQGFSEAEISRHLGDPSEIAREYLRMYPASKKRSGLWDVLWTLVVITVVLWALLGVAPLLFKITGSLLMTLFSVLLFFIIFIVVVTIAAIIYALVKGKQVLNFVIGDRKFSFRSNRQNDSCQQYVHETKTVDSQVSKIWVESYLSGIIIQQENRNDIHVELKGYCPFNRSPLSVEVVDGVLKIIDDVPEVGIYGNNIQVDMKLTIRVPQQRYDLDVKARIGSLKIYGDFNRSRISCKLGSLKIDGTHQQATMSCDLGSMKIFNNKGHGSFTSDLGSIRWYQTNSNPHRFHVKKSLGSFKNNSLKKFDQFNNTYKSQDGDYPEVMITSNLGSIRLEP